MTPTPTAFSQDREYTESHIAMAHLIKPHLELAWSHWKQVRSLKHELEVLRPCHAKSDEEAAALSTLQSGIDALPRRQREVTELVAGGLENQRIADEMGISIRTVHKHLENIYRSLNIQHRTELAAKWHKTHIA
jgi:DNA-binding NarL/FixJ family response regulator